MDETEEYFYIDSKPIEVCRLTRGSRCKLESSNEGKAPTFGYFAIQGVCYIWYIFLNVD